jgi:hypothetical protein
MDCFAALAMTVFGLGTLPPCCVTVSKRDGLYFERLMPLYFQRR